MALRFQTWFRYALERTFWSLGKRPKGGDVSSSGRYGEWLGRKFLKSKGFSIKSENWRSPLDSRLEIDLVCFREGVLVFVEIRARSQLALVNGFHSIDKRKRKTLLRAFKAYLAFTELSPENYRFDVIEIDLPVHEDGKSQIFHHENVAIFR